MRKSKTRQGEPFAVRLISARRCASRVAMTVARRVATCGWRQGCLALWAVGAASVSAASAPTQDWLDGQQIGVWLQQETQRAWQAERNLVDVQPPAATSGTEAPPHLRALYGTGRFRAAELDIGGQRYRLATDANGRLRPQQVGGYRLEAWRGQCVVLRRDGARTEVCWQGAVDAVP